jgi:hypothetical protein
LPVCDRDRKQVRHFAAASFGKSMALAIGAKLVRFQIKNPDKTGMPHQADRPVNMFAIR